MHDLACTAYDCQLNLRACTSVRTVSLVAGDRFLLVPSIIFVAPNVVTISVSATSRKYRRAQISPSTLPVPKTFSYTQMASESDRPITYFDISIGDQPIGRVIFSLYTDLVPKTAENFREYLTFSMAMPALLNRNAYKVLCVLERKASESPESLCTMLAAPSTG